MHEKETSLQLPPSDLNAEKSLLGSVLLNSKILDEVADKLNADFFYDKRHKMVYKTMINLWSEAKPVDVLFVLDALKTDKSVREAELSSIDKEFLLELVSKSSLSSSPEHTAKIIKDKYLLRSLVEISDKIKKIAFEGRDDVNEILDFAQKEIYNASLANISKNFTPINEVLKSTYERISESFETQEVTDGVPTGFFDLDTVLGGLHPSDLIILAARPSMGKTSFSLEIVKRMAIQQEVGVAFFSLEMSKEQLVDKLVASTAAIDLRKIRNGQLTNEHGEDEFVKLGTAIGQLDQANIWIDDSGHLNITELRTKARRLKSRYNVGLIVIDYLQLMSGNSGVNYGVNRVQEVSDISRNLKMLAKELNIPIIALSQLSRSVESRDDKRPMLSDLRESGSIEQDADIVMFIHRDEMYNKETKNKGKANVIIAKHRNGETGNVELAWIGRLATFENLDGAKVSNYVNK